MSAFPTKQFTIPEALKKAKEAIKKGDLSTAQQLYQAVLRRQPAHPAARNGLRRVINELQTNQSTSIQLSDPPNEQIKTIVNLYYSGQLAKAEKACEDLLRQFPESILVINVLGALFRSQNRLNEAVEAFSKVIRINPDYAEAYNNRGVVFNNLGRIQEALSDYEKAIKIKPDYAMAYNNRAGVFKGLGRVQEALADYERAIKIKPDYVEAFNNRGITFFDIGLIQEALDDYANAIKLKPDYAEVYNNRGFALKKLDRIQEALDDYEKAIKIRPDYAIAYNNRGSAFKDLGRIQEALYDYEKAIKLKPDYAEAYNNRGILFKDLSRIQEALDDYEKAINLKPDYAEVYNNRGIALNGLGRAQEALEDYDKAINLKPDYAEVYNNRGLALKDLGRIQEALKDYKKAIKLKPDYAELYNNRGLALNSLGRVQEALEEYGKAIKLKQDYAEAYSNICEIYEKKNDLKKLKIILDRAQSAFLQKDPNIQYRLAQLAIRENRFKDARDLLENISLDRLTLSMKGVCSELLAKTYDKLGMFIEAFNQFRSTNEIVAQSVDAQQVYSQRYFNKISQCSELWANVEGAKWSIKQDSYRNNSLIFLVGFPRSGTTLLDTILRSHPLISVVEEKPMVARIKSQLNEMVTPDFLSHLKDGEIQTMREVYYEELSRHVKLENVYKIIIDKLPLNITNIGLLHRVFPDSKFIITLRHPFDCVLSCFMQNFKLNDAMANFLKLKESAKLYDAVMTLWEYYCNALDLQSYIVKYEDLIEDLQGTVEPLLGFLGLSWCNSLLNYQQTALLRDKINTPSYNQVTQPLYKHAVGRWKNYQIQIQEIKPILDPWAIKLGYSV